MAVNTLTNLIQPFYDNLDVVSRELTGMIPGVTRDSEASRAAINQTVYVPVAPASAAADITPAVTSPDTGAQTIGTESITISNQRAVPIQWTGEEAAGVMSGPGYNNIKDNQIQQAIRTLTNEIEDDLTDLYTTFSRAYNAHATAPTAVFATAGDFTDASLVAKILKDNGAPSVGNRLVINTTAGANLIGKQSRMDVAGQDSMLRQGVLLDTAGFAITESAQIESPTAGTADSSTTDAAGYSVGDTVITLAAAGTGTFVAGDVITFAGDTNKYVVVSGDTDVSDGGTITIAEPGLRVAIVGATAITVVGQTGGTARNLAFHPSAIVLAQRLPYLPPEGDAADDRMEVMDSRSGLMFELALYKQYRRVHYELASAWGVKNIKPEHTAVLLGT